MHTHSHPLTYTFHSNPLAYTFTRPLSTGLTRDATPCYDTTKQGTFTRLHTHPLSHSPTHSPTHPHTHTHTHSPTHSPTHPHTHTHTHSPTHSPTYPPTHPPTHPLTHPPTHPPTQPPISVITTQSNGRPGPDFGGIRSASTRTIPVAHVFDWLFMSVDV
jgi:hypothetical protein